MCGIQVKIFIERIESIYRIYRHKGRSDKISYKKIIVRLNITCIGSNFVIYRGIPLKLKILFQTHH